jgi:hypothetical protein
LLSSSDKFLFLFKLQKVTAGKASPSSGVDLTMIVVAVGLAKKRLKLNPTTTMQPMEQREKINPHMIRRGLDLPENMYPSPLIDVCSPNFAQ